MKPFDFESDERAVKAREEYKSLRENKPDDSDNDTSDKIGRTEHGQSLAQTIAMVIVAIILVILLVLFARWIYHKVHHPSINGASTSANKPSKQSPNSSSSGPSHQNGPNSSSSNNQNSSSTSNSSGSKALANTGPGNVAAIFVGSAIAAAGLHYIISLRRFNKNRT